MRRALPFVLAAACGDDPVELPSQGGPFVIVEKLVVDRHVAVDEAAFAAFATGEEPASFTITMTVYTDDGLDAIFHRERRDGAWFSSSPSQGVIIDDTPSIEPACDGCHADNAEELGMFTLPALREAAVRDATGRIACPEEGTVPCDVAVYRDVAF
jgi:hypothetical protein